MRHPHLLVPVLLLLGADWAHAQLRATKALTLDGAKGGVPIKLDGQVIGAVGVSGGSSAQDAQVASAGIAALELNVP